MDPIAERVASRFKQAFEISVDDAGYAHDDEGNSWFVGLQYAGQFFGGGHIPSYILRGQGGGGGYHRPTPRVDARLTSLAEVARLLGNERDAGVLEDFAKKIHRFQLTERQTQYLGALERKYEPKLTHLDQLRRERDEKRDAERREKERQEAEAKAEEARLEEVGRALKREGWKFEGMYGHGVYTFEDPPYAAKMYTREGSYENVIGYGLTVTKDGKEVFKREYGRGESDKAQAVAHGVIERDRQQDREKAEQAEARMVEQEIAEGEERHREEREERQTQDFLGRVKKLEEAAATSGNSWMKDFASSIARQVAQGRMLSDKQRAVLERGFKQFRVGSVEDRILARWLIRPAS